jgi:hypothetical protein
MVYDSILQYSLRKRHKHGISLTCSQASLWFLADLLWPSLSFSVNKHGISDRIFYALHGRIPCLCSLHNLILQSQTHESTHGKEGHTPTPWSPSHVSHSSAPKNHEMHASNVLTQNKHLMFRYARIIPHCIPQSLLPVRARRLSLRDAP